MSPCMSPQSKSTLQTSMESRGRRNGTSGDMFSFPTPLGQDSDQPGSPADHLFFNGKLLPHSFPIQTPSNLSFSRSTSRTSSIGSKDSLMSSRSNSTNSRSSNCSSARTSTSEASASERKLISSGDDRERRRERKKTAVSSCQVYHHYELFAAAPVLTSRSSRKPAKTIARKGKKKSHHKDSAWFGWKIMKLFVSACKECHAIKT